MFGDVRGLDVIELGCGTAYFSAWLARRGARPTGGDITPAQLATASRCQKRSGVFFPLIQELLRSRREARRLVTADAGVEFHPGHGEWITSLRANGFAIAAGYCLAVSG